MTEAAFKYTFPIAKAEARADGNYIIGYASGPEVDTEGERMAPEAIQRFSDQINNPHGERLVYRDAHAPDGVLRDLGEITKAWVNEKFHLGIEVKLDSANPASMYLFKQITEKGKQYGMSVGGHVVDYSMDFVESLNATVLTYKNVLLDEISNTTRPAWYPSFGTVLAKSIKDASSLDDAKMGVHVVGDEITTDLLDAEVEDAEKSEVADATEEVTEKTEDTDASADVTEKAQDEEVVEEVERAGRKLSGATSNRLLALFNTMQDELTALGVLETPVADDSEKSASAAEEDTVEKTEDEGSTEPVITKSDLDVLAAALEKANERIAELEARPATALPGVISDATKKAAQEELAEVLAKASPSEKMRLAFAAHTSGK